MEDERMAHASNEARVLSVCLILLSDDHGNGRLVPSVTASRVFPRNSGDFPEALRELQEMGFVTTYTVRGQSYFTIPKWKEHQKVSHPGKPHVPPPPENLENPPETLLPDLRTYGPKDLGKGPRETLAKKEKVSSEQPVANQVTWQQVAGAYGKRYAKARRLSFNPSPHVQALTDVAGSLRIQEGDALQNLSVALDRFFADEFAIKNGFPPGLLAKQFDRFLRPPDEDTPENAADRKRRAEKATERYEKAKHDAEVEHMKKVRERSAQAPETASVAEDVTPTPLSADDKAVVAAFATQLKGDA